MSKTVNKTKAPVHYINNRRLYEAMVAWYESGKEQVPNDIVNGVIQICEGLGTRFNFRGYSYVDDMVAEAITSCTSALVLKKFDPAKSDKPFSYFNRIAWNAMIHYIKNEKKETYIKHKSMELHLRDAEFDGYVLDGNLEELGYLDDTIRMFEEKKKK